MKDSNESRREYGEAIRFALADGEIAARRWPRPGAQRLVFCHATGFCATAYRAMLARLADRFDIIALDLRGHGRTRLPADPATLKNWAPIARDIAGVLDHLHAESAEPVLLSGHSLGGASSLLAARGRKDVAGLVLIEPVSPGLLWAAAAYSPLAEFTTKRFPLVRGALARRGVWPDRADVVASYSRKRLFAHWAPGVLEDYLEDGLEPAPEEGPNGVRLSCKPAWEAAAFAAQRNWIWPAVAEAPGPVRVLAAAHPSSTVGAEGRRRYARRGAEVVLVEGVTHLVPFEQPEVAADFIRASADALKAAA
ncbi:MAG TPA: alpha/beta hydrolase [Amphiplicatus sp.]|nr:alpha/beta hydrolase [Amphiplicatus sp.]